MGPEPTPRLLAKLCNYLPRPPPPLASPTLRTVKSQVSVADAGGTAVEYVSYQSFCWLYVVDATFLYVSGEAVLKPQHMRRPYVIFVPLMRKCIIIELSWILNVRTCKWSWSSLDVCKRSWSVAACESWPKNIWTQKTKKKVVKWC